MPYIKPENASSICFVKTIYRGSGLTLNGFSFSPKKLLYMRIWGFRLVLRWSLLLLLSAPYKHKIPVQRCIARSLSQDNRKCVPLETQDDVVGTVSRSTIQGASSAAPTLDL